MTSVGERALEVMSALPVDSGRRWADVAEPFQVQDAEAVLCGAEPYHFLTRSRGASKTTDLAGCALAWLLTMPARSKIFWCASDQGQGRLAVDSISGFAARTAALSGAIEIQANKVISPKTGTVLEVLAADGPGAFGLRPDAVLVDEIANWNDGPSSQRLWQAISSAAAKREHCKMVLLTSAGSPSHFSYKILEHARTSPMWRCSERLGPAPWLSEDRLREQRERLPDPIYRQLFENEWVEGGGAFFDPAILGQAFTLPGPEMEAEPGRGGYVCGVDLGHVSDRSVAAIAHRHDAEIRLDRLMVWSPGKSAPVDLGAVERWILAAASLFPGLRVKADPWQAISMIQRLRAAGVAIEEFHFSTGSKQRLATALLEAVNGGTLRMFEAEGLRQELEELRVRQTSSGTWVFDHRPGSHDDRATAISLAVLELIEREPGDAHSYSTLPQTWGAGEDPEDTGPIIRRGGVHRRGRRYFDIGEDGQLEAPPNWEVDPDDFTTR